MFGRIVACLLALLILTPLPQGQSSRRVSPVLPGDRPFGDDPPSLSNPIVGTLSRPTNLALLSRSAGIIFSGFVTRIERGPASQTQPIETVAITFRVEHAIRGALPGTDLTISQWIGLWSAGQRYRIGERVFLFLYPKSKLGLTSAVAGPIGRFPVDSKGTIIFSPQHRSVLQTDSVLGGKSRARFSDFALAVRQACEEE